MRQMTKVIVAIVATSYCSLREGRESPRRRTMATVATQIAGLR